VFFGREKTGARDGGDAGGRWRRGTAFQRPQGEKRGGGRGGVGASGAQRVRGAVQHATSDSVEAAPGRRRSKRERERERERERDRRDPASADRGRLSRRTGCLRPARALVLPLWPSYRLVVPLPCVGDRDLLDTLPWMQPWDESYLPPGDRLKLARDRVPTAQSGSVRRLRRFENCFLAGV